MASIHDRVKLVCWTLEKLMLKVNNQGTRHKLKIALTVNALTRIFVAAQEIVVEPSHLSSVEMKFRGRQVQLLVEWTTATAVAGPAASHRIECVTFQRYLAITTVWAFSNRRGPAPKPVPEEHFRCAAPGPLVHRYTHIGVPVRWLRGFCVRSMYTVYVFNVCLPRKQIISEIQTP